MHSSVLQAAVVMVNFNISPLLAALPINGIFSSVQVGSGIQEPLKETIEVVGGDDNAFTHREAFLDALVANMSLPELGASLSNN